MLLLLAACTGSTDTDSRGEDDSTSVTDSTPTDAPVCLDSAALGTLTAHVAILDVIGRISPAQAAADVAVAFYQLPGVDGSRALNFTLSQPCTGAHDLDPSCITDVCFWTECTGVGGSWIEHAEDTGAGDTVTSFDGWLVDRGRMEIAWGDGVAAFDVTWDVRTLTAPDGRDWTFEGSAHMDGLLDLTERFDHLHPEGPLDLAVTDSTGGALTVGGVAIATWNGAAFVSTDTCASP